MEQHRPQYHFSPLENWMNDPNGMVYYQGEYHLFYQFYPDSNVWGPMHWGHAVSEDLVHWQHLPIALYPDSLGLIFSGSAVVDWDNTSGFGSAVDPPMIAIFTYHHMEGERSGRIDFQTQGIAYSTDKGRTWTKYAGNPVIGNPGIRDFRDPKVIWDQASRQWVMILAAKDRAMIYGSKDLKEWEMLSTFGEDHGSHAGVWECPDLFPMTVEGTGEKKWVLIQSINPGSPNGGSGTFYFVGNFDGKHFTPDAGFAEDVRDGNAVWLDYGRDNYAGVTWSDIPKEDGRRIFIGWMSNWDYATVVPTTKWRSAMTIPRSLQLVSRSEGYRLTSSPVTELRSLRNKSFKIDATELSGVLDLTDKTGFSPVPSEIILEFEISDPGTTLSIELSNLQGDRYVVGYASDKNMFFSDRTRSGKTAFSDKFAGIIHYAPRILRNKTVRMHLFFDVSSAELFADNGLTVCTEIFFPNEKFHRLKLNTHGKSVLIKEYTMFTLDRIWK